MTERLKVLLVEDSRADARLIVEVFKEEQIAVNIDVVRDGEDAMDYLNRVGQYQNVDLPDLIILDLNMPRKDGREVLAEVKADDKLNAIPIVILSTSQSDEDVMRTYKLQASCFITKPIDLEHFVKIMKSFESFWFSAVRFPPRQ